MKHWVYTSESSAQSCHRGFSKKSRCTSTLAGSRGGEEGWRDMGETVSKVADPVDCCGARKVDIKDGPNSLHKGKGEGSQKGGNNGLFAGINGLLGNDKKLEPGLLVISDACFRGNLKEVRGRAIDVKGVGKIGFQGTEARLLGCLAPFIPHEPGMPRCKRAHWCCDGAYYYFATHACSFSFMCALPGVCVQVGVRV